MQLLNKNWQLSGDNLAKPINTDLPMDTFSTLQKEGIIQDPYYGRHEYDVKWVGEQDWHIGCQFKPEANILKQKHQWLSLINVDTTAELSLNDKKISHLCNMHTEHIIDVTGLLKENNNLSLLLKNNVQEAARRSKMLPFPMPYSGAHNNQVAHMNLLRKTQCHAGWDWGIMLLVSGIYGQVTLVGDDQARLMAVTSTQQHHRYTMTDNNGSESNGSESNGSDNKVTLEFTVHLDVLSAGVRTFDYQFDGVNYSHTETLTVGKQYIKLPKIDLAHPKLWWPAGYGAQPLYDFSLTFGMQSIKQQIGLRTVETVSEKDKDGVSFIIKVNDVAIFCKGANWIPMDAKPSTHTRERYERLIMDAKAANMNMIRIWGGGQYEHDAFYELCDREGILIWHDLMFACALYPSMSWFLDEVSAELEYQIPRLQHFASIALWCGDNEVIGAINWFEISRNNRDTYLANYDRVNFFCQQQVEKYDTSRRFWPSSPSAGELDFGDAFHDPKSGDMHYWEVWHEGKSFDAFQNIQPRFCSEFGFQSLPSLPEVNKFCPAPHHNVTSPTMESHQKNNRGNSIIAEMFSRYFRLPVHFEQQLWLSQVQQALAIQTAVDFWRSARPICMGTLYWQLNDNWPVASWSSIEYSGRWRLLHYFAKRFFAPSLISMVATDKHIYVNAVTDCVAGASFKGQVTFRDLTGGLLQSWPLAKTFNQAGAENLLTLEISELQGKQKEGFFWLDYEGQSGVGGNVVFAAPAKQIDLPKAHVSHRFEQRNGVHGVLLSTDKPAFYVSLELAHCLRPFSDNGFAILPAQPVWIALPEDCDLTTAKEELRVYHLAASY